MEDHFDVIVSLGCQKMLFSADNVADLFNESIFDLPAWKSRKEIDGLITALKSNFSNSFSGITATCSKTNLKFAHIQGKEISSLINEFKGIFDDFGKLKFSKKKILFIRSVTISAKDDLDQIYVKINEALKMFGFSNFKLLLLVVMEGRFQKYQTCDKWILFKNRSNFIQDLNNGLKPRSYKDYFDIAISLGFNCLPRQFLDHIGKRQSGGNIPFDSTITYLNPLLYALNNDFKDAFSETVDIECEALKIRFSCNSEQIRTITDRYHSRIERLRQLRSIDQRVLFIRTIEMTSPMKLEKIHKDITEALKNFGFSRFVLILIVKNLTNIEVEYDSTKFAFVNLSLWNEGTVKEDVFKEWEDGLSKILPKITFPDFIPCH